MKPILLARLIAPGIAVESRPLVAGLIHVYRGAEVPAPPGSPALSYREGAPDERPPSPVIVRLLDPSAALDHAGDDEVRAIFARVTATRLADQGTAPRLLRALARGGKLQASVEEFITGHRLSEVLARQRASGALTPPHVALEIARKLLRLWLPARRGPGSLARLSIEPARIRVEPSGRVRALPTYEEERSRQAVGAALLHFDAVVAYSAPEQIAGEPRDDRSDMFLLGLLLHETLAGEHPAMTEGKSLFEVMTELSSRPLPRLSDRRGGLHPAVTAFVRRCLALNPAERFGSWSELAGALAGIQALHQPAGEAEIAAWLRALALPPLSPPPVQPGELEASPPLLDEAPMPEPPRRPDPAHRAVALDAGASYSMPDARPMYAASPSLRVDARPVSRAEFERFLLATGAPAPPHLGAAGASDDEPCTGVPHEAAEAYARWAGKRLPGEDEWSAAVAALGAGRLATGLVWEWTATPWPAGGRVVRGGRWRDQPGTPPRPEHRSFASGPAPDVGFRCVV